MALFKSANKILVKNTSECIHAVLMRFRPFSILFQFVLCITTLLTINHTAIADIAPIHADVIHKIVNNRAATTTYPIIGLIEQQYIRTKTLLINIEEKINNNPDDVSFMFLDVAIHEYKELHNETLNMITNGQLNFGTDDSDLAIKVTERFLEIITALDMVRRSNAAELSTNVDKAIAVLRKLHASNKLHGNTHAQITKPVPTFELEDPTFRKKAAKDAKPPAYTRYPIAPVNMYASLDNQILAAVPATPPQASSCNYTAADLAENTEVSLSTEIITLAKDLAYSPSRIFDFVSNSIEFEPYYGSVKGAMGTLISGSGNATDQASLTIALLRASNIPARYVKGDIQFDNDQRLLDWVGAKTFIAAATILAAGRIPVDPVIGNKVVFTHIWLEACIPYSSYRGATNNYDGHRWIPFDPSFQQNNFSSAITQSIPFDYSTYLSTRTSVMPHEYYENQVLEYIKTQPPRYGNNTLEDVGFTGVRIKQKFDILPASLPYEVVSYKQWDTGTTSETASIPAKHRAKLRIETDPVGVANKGDTTFSFPAIVLNRVTLSFSAVQPLCWGVPQIKVDGVIQYTGTNNGSASCAFGSLSTVLSLTLSMDELLEYGINPVLRNADFNIRDDELHAINVFAHQTSNRYLVEHANKLLGTVNQSTDSDEILGEYLHLVGMKYMRYIDDAGNRIGELMSASVLSGNHLGIVSSNASYSYLFNLPFAVTSSMGFLIDLAGGDFRPYDLSTGSVRIDAFHLAGHAGSAYESYIWQENARMDAVSSVRGIQYANDEGILVLTLTSANFDTLKGLLTSNLDASLNYSSNTVLTLQCIVNIPPQCINDSGATITIPRSLIRYEGWLGQVYIATSSTNARFAIGPYAGGFTVAPPVDLYFDPIDDISTGWEVPTFLQSPTTTSAPPILSSAINLGSNQFSTIGGDPVNMVTGNMYHTEKDISIKGHGGFPIVFERTYNSMAANQPDAQIAPLGYGWTHSFNHYLEFNDDDFDNTDEPSDNDGITSSVTWVDGTGARKFIQVDGTASGIDFGSTFTPPEGFYFQTNSVFNAQTPSYEIREKNGLTYVFEWVFGTPGEKARLVSLIDQNGNTLSLEYIGNNLDRVNFGTSRFLQFAYNTNGTISSIDDWTGRRYEYNYNTSDELFEFYNPVAVSGILQPVRYAYYSDLDGENLSHAMKEYTLPRGNGMTFKYYMNGKVFRHINTSGESLTFTYNDFRRESTTVDDRGFVSKYFFNEKGSPIKMVDEKGGVTSYTYDPVRPLNRISQTDSMGYQTNYEYDTNGNVIKITHPSGSTIENSYFNAFNEPGKVKDPNGNYTLYKYDSYGNRTEIYKLKAGYGANIDPSAFIPTADSILAWTITTYDSFGNPTVIKQVRDFNTQVGPTVEFDYTDTVNNINGLNAVSMARCGDQNGDLIIDRNTECDSSILDYDNLGRLIDGISSNWYPIHIDYDVVDRITNSTDAVGNLREFSFDANGNAVGQKVAQLLSGTPTHLDQTISKYDDSDRIISSTDAGGFVTNYEYDSVGNVIKTTSPDGYGISFNYDGKNQVIAAYDEKGHAVSREVDVAGRVYTILDPNGNPTTFDYYDASKDGRLWRQYDASGRYTEFDYDGNGNITRLTVSDPSGSETRTTNTTYDALNRPTRIVGPVYTDATLGQIRPVSTYVYDNLGNQTHIYSGYTDSVGNTTSDVLSLQEQSTYDDLGRLLSKTDPLNTTWLYEYDINSNITKITDPKNQIIERTYLYGGLLDVQTAYLSPTDPNPHIIDYDYDDLGQVLKVTSPEVTYSYYYDEAHRLTDIVDNRGDKRLQYQYSPGGLLDNMLDSEGNQTDYLYDPVGRLTSIWASNGDLINYIRDPAGRLTEKWYSNGVNSRYQYNTDDTLSQIINKAADGSLISQHDYTFDGFGNRDTYQELINSVISNIQYDYDPLNRLVSVNDLNNSNALIESYTYDYFDNRTTRTDTTDTQAYIYDNAHQLNEIRQGSTSGAVLGSFIYDSNGNLTSKSESGTTLTLTYDALDRQILAAKTGISTETYAYDPQGRRIEKTSGTVTTRYRYSGADIVAEYNTSWSQAQYLYTHGPGTDEPLIRATPIGMAQYYHQDGMGSVVGVSDMVGAVQGTASYDAWGNTTNSTGNIPQYGYTGREPDATGLNYHRARYYDPTVGRFTQRDPKGFIDGINQYVYAVNNPVNYTDPSGTSAFNVSFINEQTAGASYFGSSNTTYSRVTLEGGFYSGRQSLQSSNDSAQDVALGFIPGYDLIQATQNSNAGFVDYAIGILGIAPGLGKLGSLGVKGVSRFATKNTSLVTHPFSSGGSHITTSTTLSRFKSKGSKRYGSPQDGLFLSPKSEIDNLLQGVSNRTDIEIRLGLRPGQLESGKLIRIDVDNPLSNNLRLPSTGNYLYRPGSGYTIGGVREAVIDAPKIGTRGIRKSIIRGL